MFVGTQRDFRVQDLQQLVAAFEQHSVVHIFNDFQHAVVLYQLVYVVHFAEVKFLVLQVGNDVALALHVQGEFIHQFYQVLLVVELHPAVILDIVQSHVVLVLESAQNVLFYLS